jgi:hypothetical protein
MRAVGLVRAATGGGYGLLGPRRKPPELCIAMPRSSASPDVDFSCRADGRIGPMIELTHSRRRALSG